VGRCRVLSRSRVRGRDAKTPIVVHGGDDARGDPDAVGRGLCQCVKRGKCGGESVVGVAGCRGGRFAAVVRTRATAGLPAEELLDVRTTIPPVPPGTAITRKLAGVAPAAEGVEADAQETSRLAEAQPRFAVGLACPHVPLSAAAP